MITSASQNQAAKDTVRDCTNVLSGEICGSAQVLDDANVFDGIDPAPAG